MTNTDTEHWINEKQSINRFLRWFVEERGKVKTGEEALILLGRVEQEGVHILLAANGRKIGPDRGIKAGDGTLYIDGKKWGTVRSIEMNCTVHPEGAKAAEEAMQRTTPEKILGKCKVYDLDVMCRDLRCQEVRLDDQQSEERKWRQSVLEYLTRFTAHNGNRRTFLEDLRRRFLR